MSGAQVIYSVPAEGEALKDTLLHQHLMQNHPNAPTIHEFLEMLAVCHTVIPETVDGELRYQAASPGRKIENSFNASHTHTREHIKIIKKKKWTQNRSKQTNTLNNI